MDSHMAQRSNGKQSHVAKRSRKPIKTWVVVLMAIVFYQVCSFGLTVFAATKNIDWLVKTEALPGGGQSLEFSPLTIVIPLMLTGFFYIAAMKLLRGALPAMKWCNKENYQPIARAHFIRLALGYGAGIIVIANLVEFVVLRALQPPHTQGIVTNFIVQNPLVGLVLACMIAPAWEESFFRGFVLRRLFERFGYWPATLITAIVFALAHTEIVSVASIAYLLVVLGGTSLMMNHLFLRHRNLLLNMVVHAAFNLSSFTMLLLLK